MEAKELPFACPRCDDRYEIADQARDCCPGMGIRLYPAGDHDTVTIEEAKASINRKSSLLGHKLHVFQEEQLTRMRRIKRR